MCLTYVRTSLETLVLMLAFRCRSQSYIDFLIPRMSFCHFLQFVTTCLYVALTFVDFSDLGSQNLAR